MGLWSILSVVVTVATAHAAPPPETELAWRLRAAPSEAVDAASAAALARGATGEDAIPACRRLVTGLVVCLTPAARPGEIAMRGAILAAGGSESAGFDAVRDSLEGAWARVPAQTHSVEGIKGRYFVRAAGDGFDSAALLRPELLARLAGADPVVAIPEDGTLVWWVPGDEDFDKMLAVGVRRMAEASPHPVSPKVYRYDGDKWVVWGQARGEIGLPSPLPPAL